MSNIQAVKIGNMVNLSINGKLHKKNCGTSEEANELYRLVLIARETPTDENIKAVRMFLNEKTRVAYLCGLETDLETGEAFLEGFNTPIPLSLLETLKDYHENKYPLDGILNFWKLLMINPDVRIRKTLFDFITTHDFVLTDKGYMVTYKAVYRKDEKDEEGKVVDKTYAEFIAKQHLFVKKTWKCSPNKYVVYQNLGDSTYAITKVETAEGWDEEDKNIEILGKLGDLFDAIYNVEVVETEKSVVPMYTDMHSKTMSIQLGVPVVMDRKECDSDPAVDCSYGLHVGATKYVEKFGNSSTAILVCLVNPAHVVAVPKYDHSKMRVAEYFPFALATYTNGKIDIIEEKYFESDYCNYEQKELEEQIAKVKANELPYETAKKAEAESRPMKELMKMLELRLVDLT